jgi:predicted O-methyltransferase YrrM
LEYAIALFRIVVTRQPTTMLEIGMANGASTIAILSALAELGGKRLLISIDPNQSSEWHNVGINNVTANGLMSYHRLIEEPDYLALPNLVREHTPLEAAYIDGWHTFDYTLLDFFYIDKMLAAGGIVGFNDCGYRATSRVLRFVVSHRKYNEIDAGIKQTYKGRNMLFSLARRLLNMPDNDRWFSKTSDWEPAWNYYASF